jgi:3-methyladenine DNA glycosylase AlkD
MHPRHPPLRKALEALAGRPARVDGGYSGSPHASYGVATPALRALARSVAAEQRTATPGELLALLDSLFAGQLQDEKTLAALILSYARAARRAATPARVDAWLGHLAGWAEIDALCQNVFQADDLLIDWPAWRGWIGALAAHPDINRRRASLVLLNGPVKASADPRLARLAFANIDALQGERTILITKAVSWLLRSLIARHRADVVEWLAEHSAALPAIAVRETTAKLETGRKQPRAGH